MTIDEAASKILALFNGSEEHTVTSVCQATEASSVEVFILLEALYELLRVGTLTAVFRARGIDYKDFMTIPDDQGIGLDEVEVYYRKAARC